MKNLVYVILKIKILFKLNKFNLNEILNIDYKIKNTSFILFIIFLIFSDFLLLYSLILSETSIQDSSLPLIDKDLFIFELYPGLFFSISFLIDLK